MTHYNTVNLKLSNTQLSKLKSKTKTGTDVTLNLSSNAVGESDDETHFPHKLFLTNTEASKIREAFANGSSANIKFWKIQLFKMMQFGRFNFLDLINPARAVINNIDKIQNLARNFSDDKIIIVADLFRAFKKASLEGSGITMT